MLFKGFLVRINGSRHCASVVTNISKRVTTRYYTHPDLRTHYHNEVVLPKKLILSLIKLTESKYQFLENTGDRGIG